MPAAPLAPFPASIADHDLQVLAVQVTYEAPEERGRVSGGRYRAGSPAACYSLPGSRTSRKGWLRTSPACRGTPLLRRITAAHPMESATQVQAKSCRGGV